MLLLTFICVEGLKMDVEQECKDKKVSTTPFTNKKKSVNVLLKCDSL